MLPTGRITGQALDLHGPVEHWTVAGLKWWGMETGHESTAKETETLNL